MPSVKFPFTWSLKCTGFVFFICFVPFCLPGLNEKKSGTLPQYEYKSYKKILGMLLLAGEVELQ